jgi:hypothetical protein
MKRPWARNAETLLSAALAVVIVAPLLIAAAQRASASGRAAARIAALAATPPRCAPDVPLVLTTPERTGPGLSSWRTIGGCGAGASTGNAAGVKWIGRSVSGGLFGVQCQVTYTRLATNPERPEHHAFANALVTRALTDRWVLGANVPLVLKYMRDPYESGADLSNTGLGDISALLTYKMGPIGATALTATVGFPTGNFDGRYRMRILNQSQQRGFGKTTGSLTLDHTSDEIWGLTVVGATASWRGGENVVNNYRAPTGSVYGYVGYFMGPLVPALGLSVTGATGHDRDQTVPQITGLYSAAANLSLEWSTDWLALLVGASIPYQYDGTYQDTEGRPRSPWGWAPWVVGVGMSFSPF